MRRLALAAVLALLVYGPADAAGWPVFRGTPDLAGIARSPLAPPLKRLWLFKTGDAIRSSPVIAQGKVFVGADDGCVYAFGR
jgi:outer membrane protein assembly factor BamB